MSQGTILHMNNLINWLSLNMTKFPTLIINYYIVIFMPGRIVMQG